MVTDFNGRVAEFVYFTGATASGTLYDLKEIQLKNGTGTKVIAFEYTTTGDDTSKHNITRLVDAK
jgi:hypothetical protein